MIVVSDTSCLSGLAIGKFLRFLPPTRCLETRLDVGLPRSLDVKIALADLCEAIAFGEQGD